MTVSTTKTGHDRPATGAFALPGMRVLTTHGTMRIVAMIHPDGTIYAHGPRGLEAILPIGEAWGGEADALEHFHAQAA